MLACSVTFVLFGFVNTYAPTESYDPFWFRLILSGLCLALFILSYFRTVLAKLFLPLLYGFFITVFLWLLFLAYANEFRMCQALQLLAGTLILNLAIMVPAHLLVFNAFTIGAISLAFWSSPVRGFPFFMFAGLLLLGQTISYIVISLKYRSDNELIVAKEKAEEMSRMKDLFLAKTSHELRTPLNGILGFTQLLLADEKDPERRRMHQIVGNSSELLFQLINDLLDFSKLSVGEMHFDHQPFVLRDLVETVSAGSDRMAREKGLVFTVAIGASVPHIVIGDRTRTGQILMNLLSNAVKFTDHGTVKLSVERETVPAGGIMLVVTVADTGTGMPAAQISHAFEGFVQLTDNPDKRRQGLGLGLSIVKSILDMMHGTITVDSIVGSGSTFVARIPLELPGD